MHESTQELTQEVVSNAATSIVTCSFALDEGDGDDLDNTTTPYEDACSPSDHCKTPPPRGALLCPLLPKSENALQSAPLAPLTIVRRCASSGNTHGEPLYRTCTGSSSNNGNLSATYAELFSITANDLRDRGRSHFSGNIPIGPRPWHNGSGLVPPTKPVPNTPLLAKVVFPNVEFKVTKWHHSRRWLKQDRLLRLTEIGVENVNVYTGKVSKFHTYTDVDAVKLVNQRYFVLCFNNDHDYHYKTESAVRICWEINERLKAIESRERFKMFIARRISSDPRSKESLKAHLSEAFRSNKVPIAVDLQHNLLARQQESMLELQITELVMDTKSDEGKHAAQVKSKTEQLLKPSQFFGFGKPTGTALLAEVRYWLQELKVQLQAFFSEACNFTFPDSVVSSPGDGSLMLQDGSFSRRSGPFIIQPSVPGSYPPLTSSAQLTVSPDLTSSSVPGGLRSKLAKRKRMMFVEEKVFKKPWRDGGAGTDDEVARSVDICLQKFLLKDLHDKLRTVVESDPSVAEKSKEVRRKLALVRHKPPAYFGIPRKLHNCGWADAVRELNKMSQKRLPVEKMECILVMVRQICIVSSVDSQTKAATDMSLDDILPIFLYCIARCKLEDPFVEAEYISVLSDGTTSDEHAYYLTVFFSALEYIATIDPLASDPFDPEPSDSDEGNVRSPCEPPEDPGESERVRSLSAPPSSDSQFHVASPAGKRRSEQLCTQKNHELKQQHPSAPQDTPSPKKDPRRFSFDTCGTPIDLEATIIRARAHTPPLCASDFADVQFV
eukprot:gene7716-11850_t